MQAEDFLRNWSAGSPAHALGERAGAPAHFIDLCRVLGVPEPGDPDSCCFERGLTKTGSTGTPGERHVLRLGEVARPELQQRLRALWLAHESHNPRLSNREITVQASRAPSPAALNECAPPVWRRRKPATFSRHACSASSPRAPVSCPALRDAWLNPPEWTERVPEVVPLGMSTSPCSDRIVARPAGLESELARRTLANLYNQRPAWLAQAHAMLDAAVAAACGWTDWTPALSDDGILHQWLALNRERAAK